MYTIKEKESTKIIDVAKTEDDAKKIIEKLNENEGKKEFYTYKRANLQEIRKNRNMSQSQLAKEACVNLSMITFYEQGVKDINKAQAITLYKISRVLKCSIEDLLEFEEE